MKVFDAEISSKTILKHLVLIQIICFFIVGIPVLVLVNNQAMLSMIYGQLLMSVMAWLVHKKLNQTAKLSIEQEQKSLLKSAGIRFVLVIILLYIAHLIGLHLLGVAAGMFLGQLTSYIYYLNVLHRIARKHIEEDEL